MKFNIRLAAIFCVITVASIIGYMNLYKQWKRKEVLRLQSGSNIAETSAGRIEYSIRGEGAAVLIAHGTPGGYDVGMAFSRLVGSERLTFIGVSRPGYLQTPLMAGKTAEEQADLYMALLDTLGIEQTAIVGISGGGPSALQFALRHPTRCRGLVMVSAVTHRYTEEALKQGLSPFKRLLRFFYERLIIFDPFLYALLLLIHLIPSTTTDLLRTTTLYQLRETGYKNDMGQFSTLSDYPLEAIVTPTLIIHGTADEEVPLEYAWFLADRLVNRQMLIVAGGGHQTFYTHMKTVMPALRRFLEGL